MEPLALDNDHDDREVTKEATDEDNNIEHSKHIQQNLHKYLNQFWLSSSIRLSVKDPDRDKL